MKIVSDELPFRWRTPSLGHEWKNSGGLERLIPKSGGFALPGSKARGGVLEFSPPPGAFREFAMLKMASGKSWKAPILAFANKYGDLIAQPHEGHQVLGSVAPDRKHATLKAWCQAIQHMHRAVEMWDRIIDPQRREELGEVILRRKDHIAYRVVHHPRERRGDDETYMLIAAGKDIAAYPARDITRAASRALQLEIRDALTDTTTPSHSTPNLTRDLRLVLDPVNLLAFMWLTFARVASGEIEERLCEICEVSRFYVGSGPGLHRGDKVTCSAVCRKRKQRLEDEARTDTSR